jgi:hypothetical protein
MLAGNTERSFLSASPPSWCNGSTGSSNLLSQRSNRCGGTITNNKYDEVL